jgi:hypothetical protein
MGTTTVIDASRNLTNVNLVKFRENGASFYISPSNPNTLNAQHDSTADNADMWINYRGYNDTFSNFRDFRIGDGKGIPLLFVDGSARAFDFQSSSVLQMGGTTFIDSSRNATFAKATLGSGTNYPLQVSSTQRYQIQIRNENNTVNSSYGWWLATDTNFNFALHADGSADKFTLTRDGNATFAGTISSGAITAAGAITNTSGSITSYESVKAGQGGIYTNSVERISNAGNLTNIKEVNATGRINISAGTGISEAYVQLGITNTASSAGLFLDASNGGRKYEMQSTTANELIFYDRSSNAYRARIMANGNFKIEQNSLQMGNTVVIDASRNATFAKQTINATVVPSAFAWLNIGSTGSGETRAIDIDGSWSAGESKAISFTHGTALTNLVGQIKSTHISPSSSLSFGRLYHGGDSSVYPLVLTSTSTTAADLNLIGNFQISGTTVIDASRNVLVGGSLHFNSATNSSFIGPSSTVNIRYGADGIHQFDTYNGGWGTRAQITDTNLNLGSNVGFQLNGTTVIDANKNITSGVVTINTTSSTALNVDSSANYILVPIGAAAQTQYTDVQFITDGGNGEIFKAGTGYTGWGGARAFNIYNSDGVIAFHPSGTANVLQITSTVVNSTKPIQISGTTVIDASRKLINVTPDAATAEYGISMVGNFGQWQAHTAYASGFNVEPAYWGWNYVQGNANAPNTSSNQWYRNRVSLGDAYGKGTSVGDFWCEMAYPRYDQSTAGHMWMRVCENGSVGSWSQVGSSIIGNFTATGNVTAYSDERLKTDIQTLDGKKVLQMRGVSFTKDGESGSGVIAQELEKIAPELVHSGEKYKSVAYGNITGYLIEAVKEQQKEIDELKSLVKQLLEK